MNGSAAQPPHPPLRGPALALGAIGVALATFMNVLDTSIANVSLPTIAGDLGASANQGTWVITSFGVANAIAMPLTGWLTQRYGAVRLFVTSVVLFLSKDDESSPKSAHSTPAAPKKKSVTLTPTPIVTPHGGGAGAVLRF